GSRPARRWSRPPRRRRCRRPSASRDRPAWRAGGRTTPFRPVRRRASGASTRAWAGSGLLEEPRDLVARERGQRPLARALHEHDALLARHDLADEVAVDLLAGQRVDDDAGLG